MTADDAFDNLMNKNAIPIPMAKPTECRRSTDAAPAGDDAQAAGETMRVDSLFDEKPGDYRPGSHGSDSRRGVYANPTETDLDPVDEALDVDSAGLHGARVIGRDAASADVPADDGFRDATVYDDAPEDDVADSGLGMARRVRRFAYAPLSGMEHFENEVRDMMARLIAHDPDKPSLLVTSAMRGEGRTELAIRLALAMAKRVGYRVLLADFDMRRPRVAARLGISSKHFALADVLRGSCPLGEALVVSEEDGLYVLPSRPSDREGDDILDSRQARGLFGQLHATFDFAVIDCGPVTTADAMILCRVTGSAAVAGYCGLTTAAQMADAGAKLEAAGAHVAGALLTGA